MEKAIRSGCYPRDTWDTMSLTSMARMNCWPSQSSCSATASWKQCWGVISHDQLRPHQARSWVLFLAQLMEMKPVQCIVRLVAVVTTVAIVQACPMVHVRRSCGPCTLIDQRHRTTQVPGMSWSTHTTGRIWFQLTWSLSAQTMLPSMKHWCLAYRKPSASTWLRSKW